MKSISKFLNLIFHSAALMLLLAPFSSCDIQKRLYSNGYYIDRNDHTSASSGKKKNETSVSESKTTKSEETQTEISTEEKQDEKIQEQKISSDLPKQDKNSGSAFPETKVQNKPDQKKLENFDYQETPADRDADRALLFMALIFVISIVGFIIAVGFAVKAQTENGRDGYEYSPRAERRAQIVLTIGTVILIVGGLFLYFLLM